LLPGRDDAPCGGYKVIYEYANYFVSTGSDVHILYPHERGTYFHSKERSPFYKIKNWLGFYYHRSRNEYRAGEWFNFSHAVQKDFCFIINDHALKKYPKDSLCFASSVETAYELHAVKRIASKNKFYLIQDFENWNVPDEAVYESYKFPMHKIVISQWLKEKVEMAGSSATVIPNGFNFDYFKLSNPVQNRNKTEICMLYHRDDRKRCSDSMAALSIVREIFPDLHVTMFGTPEKPADLPAWYSYHRAPDRELHNTIYNDAAIYVGASMAEGFALPPAEAMICGCAVCLTEIPGFSAYAKNNTTALLSPVYDVEALARNIISLMSDDGVRIRIATAGNGFIQKFRWEESFKAMQKLVDNI
jgi:glycosyltransferase involved in cell wall biosynthesis